MVHELILKRGRKFRVGCTPRPTKIFLQILVVQHLYFLFQLVSSFRKCPFGFKTACFDGTLRCGIWLAKSPVQNTPRNFLQKNHKTVYILKQSIFLQRLMFYLFKKEHMVTLVLGNKGKSTDPLMWHIESRFATHYVNNIWFKNIYNKVCFFITNIFYWFLGFNVSISRFSLFPAFKVFFSRNQHVLIVP